MFCPIIKDKCNEDCAFAYECDNPDCEQGRTHCSIMASARAIDSFFWSMINVLEKQDIELPPAVKEFLSNLTPRED